MFDRSHMCKLVFGNCSHHWLPTIFRSNCLIQCCISSNQIIYVFFLSESQKSNHDDQFMGWTGKENTWKYGFICYFHLLAIEINVLTVLRMCSFFSFGMTINWCGIQRNMEESNSYTCRPTTYGDQILCYTTSK